MKSIDMINQIKTLLGVEETKLAQATLENGTVITAEEFSAGKEVFIQTDEEKVAMPPGRYQLEDGMELVVEEEGIILSIGEPKEEVQEEVEASEETEISEEVQEENLEEEEKEEMGYATKEELAEVKDMIEEIKAMIEKKEDMSSQESTEEVKEELSAVEEPVEKITHNPEGETKSGGFLYGQSRATTTLDRVMSKISNIKK